MGLTAESKVIKRGELYPLGEIQRRLGLGVHAIRVARRGGLVVRRIGRSSFVLGDDVIDYFESAGKVVT